MPTIKLRNGEQIPLEMHKVRIVQPLNLLPIKERAAAMKRAGFNTFLLKNREVFLDMITDSGVNAMSQEQQAAMLNADDSYAGSETFFRLADVIKGVFGTEFFLPVHQGRAAENIIARTFVKPGQATLMNFHFTTTKTHINANGGKVVELLHDDATNPDIDRSFKGNIDVAKLRKAIKDIGAENIAFIRVEAGTNLIGGQPVALANMREVVKIGRQHKILTILDASLLSDNLYFIKKQELEFADTPLNDITKEIGRLFDVVYFSGRKLGCARGGAIITNQQKLHENMQELVPMFEGFITYGGMSVREMEAMAVGLRESLEMNVIEQTPIFVAKLSEELKKNGVPVVEPSGGLGCHLNAMKFCEHLPQKQYRAGALAAAMFIISGVRGMERGAMSEDRLPNGTEKLSDMELLRLAMPKRVFTLSQIMYVADRVTWLWENRQLIGGLKFIKEPKVIRFFFGKLESIDNWPENLVKAYQRDFGQAVNISRTNSKTCGKISSSAGCEM
jgi:tryptophanase